MTKTLFIVTYVSGTIYYMIFVNGTHVYKDNIQGFCTFYFFGSVGG